MAKLRSTIVGSLSFLALCGNTLFWLGPLLAVTAVRALVPARPVVRGCRRAAEWIATNWIGFNIWGLTTGGCMRWDVFQPGGLRRDGTYLVTSNHLSAVDIMIVQWLFHRRIPMLKFFLKHQLFWVPGLGIAWWALEFPFMRRHSRAVLAKRPELRQQDFETARRACERFRDSPTTILNFLEGTRFSPAKRARQGAPFANLLMPRAGGIAQVVSTLGPRLDAWLDVTIVYPAGTPSFWQLISGQVPLVRVHVEQVPTDPAWAGRSYLEDEAFRTEFQAFVRDLWTAKDARIDLMRSPATPAFRSS